MNKYILPATTVLVSVFIGIVLTLFIPALRFTQYVEPPRHEVSPTQARAEMLASGSGNFLFFDVRSESRYNDFHAVDSTSLPIARLSDLWRNGLPRTNDKQIYLICTDGRLACVAYDFLAYHGYRNIKHIEGGLERWIAEKQPTVGMTFTKEE